MTIVALHGPDPAWLYTVVALPVYVGPPVLALLLIVGASRLRSW